MRFYIGLMAMYFKTQMQYKASFLLTVIGQFITAFTAFFGLQFIFQRVSAVDGFTYGQVLMCFSVVMLSFSIGEMIGGAFASFSGILGNGWFDRALVRPRGVILQLLFSRIDLTRLGLLVQAVLVLAYAIPKSGVVWTGDKVVTLVLMIACGAALFYALFLLKAACAFFITQDVNFMNLFTYGAREFGQYPFSVYGKGVLSITTYLIPLAWFQYYPLLYLLGRRTGAVWMLSPLVALLFLPFAFGLFRFGIRRYKSVGS